MKVYLCYRIEADAAMGYDPETEEDCEAYLRVSFDADGDIKEEFIKKTQEEYREVLANEFDIDKNYITPITNEEYLENCDDEEEESINE